MTRKKAIEIVVTNVKMGWMIKGWKHARVWKKSICFFASALSAHPLLSKQSELPAKNKYMPGGWVIPRTWLEENGHL